MEYRQLELIYEKLYAISLETNEMINSRQYNNIVKSSEKKNKLISQLQLTIKSLKPENLPEHIESLKNKFLNQEKENIENLKTISTSTKVELNKLTKDLKLISAYSQNTNSPSIVDIQE